MLELSRLVITFSELVLKSNMHEEAYKVPTLSNLRVLMNPPKVASLYFGLAGYFGLPL